MRVFSGSAPILITLLLFILSAGCAKQGPAQVAPGATTTSMLKSQLGEPAHVWTPSVRPQARLLDYPDGCSFQVERDVVVGVSCLPAGNEVTLQYWRHKWIGDTQRFEELPGSGNIHGQKRYQFASRQAGMAVIYDEASESILRVVRYDRH